MRLVIRGNVGIGNCVTAGDEGGALRITIPIPANGAFAKSLCPCVEYRGCINITGTTHIEAHYTRLDDTARAGYFGSLLRETIDEMVRLLPGQPAPEFSATLPDGTVMTPDDFRGKYLLIYNWGFCPGSIQLEKEATDLYNSFSDRLNVLGITDNLEVIRNAARTTPPDDELFGMKLKPAFESMVAHPWMDVESGTGENGRIGELYAFGGMPYFVLISPDGKIISRGFHETFYETKKIFETGQ